MSDQAARLTEIRTVEEALQVSCEDIVALSAELARVSREAEQLREALREWAEKRAVFVGGDYDAEADEAFKLAEERLLAVAGGRQP